MDRTHCRVGWLGLVLCFAGCEMQGLDAIPTTAPVPPTGTVSQLPNGGEIQCYFSPHGGCTEAVVREITSARKSISVQAYSFTSAAIAKALEAAHLRGVQVVVVLDKSQRTEQYSSADFLAHAGIETYVDAEHAIAHNKIMLIDGQTLITGSFNFTKQAETSNAENLLVIRQMPQLYAEYQQNFESHLRHSEPYVGRGTETSAPTHGTDHRGVTEKRRVVPVAPRSSVGPVEVDPPEIQNAQDQSPIRAQ